MKIERRSGQEIYLGGVAAGRDVLDPLSAGTILSKDFCQVRRP
jgi:hypothetical protein